MKPRIRLVTSLQPRERRKKLYSVLKRGRKAYPNSASLRKRWIRARLLLGSKKPAVRIGCQRDIKFARTLREAGIFGGIA